jgi:hypothetical protein
VLVTVLDEKTNQPIDGLTASDFQARVRGREILIRAVAPAPVQRRILFVLDRSASMTSTMYEDSLERFKPNSLEKLTLEDALSAVPSSDRVAFRAFAGKYSKQTEFMQPSAAPGRVPEILSWKPKGRGPKWKTALWDNLDAALRMLTPHKPGDVIVAISDGGDNMSRLSEGKVREELLSAGIPVLAMVVVNSLVASPSDLGGLLSLLDLTKATGGAASAAGSVVPGIDRGFILQGLPDQLVRQLTHQYALELDVPPMRKPEKWKLGVGSLNDGRKARLFFPRFLSPCGLTPDL